MRYYYMTEEGELIATVERIGNGTPTAPVRWISRWSLIQQALGLQDEVHNDRAAADTAVRCRYPDAVIAVYNRRGDRVR